MHTANRISCFLILSVLSRNRGARVGFLLLILGLRGGTLAAQLGRHWQQMRWLSAPLALSGLPGERSSAPAGVHFAS